jgi:hypothetical protein
MAANPVSQEKVFAPRPDGFHHPVLVNDQISNRVKVTMDNLEMSQSRPDSKKKNT